MSKEPTEAEAWDLYCKETFYQGRNYWHELPPHIQTLYLDKVRKQHEDRS